MHEQEQKTIGKAKPELLQQVHENSAETPTAQGALQSQHDPTVQLSCRIGDASCAGAHAATLNRATAIQPAPTPAAWLRLQRQYGNHFVQRVMALTKPGGSQVEGATKRTQRLQTATDEGIVQQQIEEEEEPLRSKPAESSVQRQTQEEEEETKASNIQTKLTLGAPDDVYEQEANQVAEQVSSFYNSNALGGINRSLLSAVDVSKVLGLARVQKSTPTHTMSSAQRLRIFTNADAQSAQPQTVDPSVEQRVMHSRGSGSPLPAAINTSMALQTGYDFSNVRIKTDSEAGELSSSLHARAFALGSDIWLGQNESINDVNLMAHELTHVVQQGAATRISPKSVAGFDNMQSTSKVMTYLQALTNGAGTDPSIYRKEIEQFQKDNTSEQIDALQQQILEKPQPVDIRQKSNSQTLRGCAGCGGSCNAPAPRATPTNFRQTAGSDAGGGVLHFEYEWDSSSGSLADLSGVEVGERVDYTQTKNPPFTTAQNPTILWVPGSDGRAQDNHSPHTIRPYEVFTERATQYYRWRQGTGSPVNLMGPIDIVREITQKPDSSYKYRLTKSGLAAEIDPLP